MQQADTVTIAALEREALQATQRGDGRRAGQLWESILGHAPEHPRALRSLSHLAFQAGDLKRARGLLERLVQVDGREVQQWLNLSVVCLAMGDEAAEESALRSTSATRS